MKKVLLHCLIFALLFCLIFLLLKTFGCNRGKDEEQPIQTETITPAQTEEVSVDEVLPTVDNPSTVSTETEGNMGTSEAVDISPTDAQEPTQASATVPATVPETVPETEDNEQNIFEGSPIEGEIGL